MESPLRKRWAGSSRQDPIVLDDDSNSGIEWSEPIILSSTLKISRSILFYLVSY